MSNQDTLILNEDTKTQIINAAIAAPSADNSQPFQYQWQETDTLHLWIDKSRAGKASDNRFILSDIALGAVIENIAVEADAFQLTAKVEYFPNGEQDKTFVASISFQPNQEESLLNHLANEIPKRCADRRFPFKGPIKQTDKDLLTLAAAKHSSNLIWFDNKKAIKSVLPVIQKAESIRFKSKILHQELFSTVKFGDEDDKEGMHISVLAIEKPAQPFFKLMKKWSFMKTVNAIGGATMLGLRSVRLPIMMSPALALITTKNKDRVSILNTGRAIQRVWLQATQSGLSVHPYAAPGIFSLGFIDCEAQFDAALKEVGDEMQQVMQSSGNADNYGVMFLRLGMHKAVTHRTKRRDSQSFER